MEKIDYFEALSFILVKIGFNLKNHILKGEIPSKLFNNCIYIYYICLALCNIERDRYVLLVEPV